MRDRFVGLLMLGFLTAGCASTRPPVTVDCQSLRMVPSPTQRVEFRSWGYSLVPPQGEGWCIQSSGARGTVFYNHPLMGKVLETRPSDAELRHTFAFSAAADEVPPGAKVDTPTDMFTVVQQRILGVVPGSRFTLVESKFVPDSSLGADCIRFDATVEERDNPGARGVVLVGVMRDNFLCRHPSARTPTIVLISASERFAQGTVSGPLLIDTLRSQWEPAVRSVQFMPRP